MDGSGFFVFESERVPDDIGEALLVMYGVDKMADMDSGIGFFAKLETPVFVAFPLGTEELFPLELAAKDKPLLVGDLEDLDGKLDDTLGVVARPFLLPIVERDGIDEPIFMMEDDGDPESPFPAKGLTVKEDDAGVFRFVTPFLIVPTIDLRGPMVDPLIFDKLPRRSFPVTPCRRDESFDSSISFLLR